jgi:putative endopeptidase
MRRIALAFVALSTAAVLAQTPPTSGIDAANIDPAVRPQDDFYGHVNGKWLDRTEIPTDRATYGAFVELADKAEADLRALIEAAAGDRTRAQGSATQQVGDLYTSFLNVPKVDELGAAPVRPQLEQIKALATLEDVARMSGELSAINSGGPIDAGIEADAKDPSTPILYVAQGGTALPDRDYYLQDDPRLAEIRTKYQAFLQTLFTLAEWPNASADAEAVLAFEADLARVHWTRVESRDAVKTYNKFALADLAREMPGFDWMAWVRAQGLDRATHVVVQQPSYFKSLGEMASSTPLPTWKAWLAAHYLMASAPFLSQPFVNAHFEFFGRTISGQPEQRDRWKRGVSLVNGQVGMAVGKLYVEQTFPPEAKARMETMVAHLIEAYRESITTLDWMTPATRQEALAKLGRFTTKIGYPETWRDYTGLVIEPDDLLGNVHRAERFETAYQVAKLGKPVDRTEWLMTPQTVNAYYNPVMNEIVFPAAILQPPFFDFGADDAVNYGGIGAVIGHEIGHGFDDQGRRYDGTGALRDWWTEQDAREFAARAQKLIEQYNAAEPLPGLHINGELTIGENIGDLGGVSIAYQAYKLALGGQPSPTIGGLTGEQRLFAGWAQIWRSKYREPEARRRLLVDPHAPPKYRVNIPLSNVPGFYEAYGVRPSDDMYLPPGDRVQIW